jgi:hypothetical protein
VEQDDAVAVEPVTRPIRKLPDELRLKTRPEAHGRRKERVEAEIESELLAKRNIHGIAVAVPVHVLSRQMSFPDPSIKGVLQESEMHDG